MVANIVVDAVLMAGQTVERVASVKEAMVAAAILQVLLHVQLLAEWEAVAAGLRGITVLAVRAVLCTTARLQVTLDMAGLEVAQDAALVIPTGAVAVEE